MSADISEGAPAQASNSREVRCVIPRDRAAGVDVARFKREIAFAASRLEHPNIVPLVSAGEEDGELYYTMSRITGETLDARLARGSKNNSNIPIDEAMRILHHVARGLANGHGYGILHRALQPANIVLTPDAALISEFGVVRALDLAKGTPPDPQIDNRSDIRDFGVLAYEVLTGDAPLGDAPTLISKRRTDAPHALATLITRAMALNPDDRPQTASEIASAIDDIISPNDSIFGALGAMTYSSTVEARSDYYRSRGAVGLALIAIAAIVGGYFTWRSSQTSTSTTNEPLAANALAVIPFAITGTDTSMNYVASGVTDDVAAALSRLPSLHVASRSAMDAAVGVFGSDTKQIGSRLQVSNVLSGSVQRTGDDVRLVAQLTDVSASKAIWNKTYAAKFEQLGRVEDSLARDVGATLKIPAAAIPKASVAVAPNAAARDAYYRAEFAQRTLDEASLRRAVEYFGRAAQADPKFVAAWAGLAQSWAMLSDDFISPKEAIPPLRDAVAHGLAIDTADASLRVLHGVIAYLYDRDAKAAQSYMSPALVRETDVPLAIKWYPAVLWTNGFRDSATAYLKRVVAQDSTSPVVLGEAWNYARLSGDALRSIEYCGKLRVLRASAWCDAWQQLDIGQGDDAATMVDRQTASAGVRNVGAQLDRVNALVAAKRLDDARRVVGDVDRAAGSGGSYMRPDNIALMHAALGDSTGALQWWERAATDGSSGVGALYWRTAKSPTRTDPRLAAFAKRVGLSSPPSYWP